MFILAGLCLLAAGLGAALVYGPDLGSRKPADQALRSFEVPEGEPLEILAFGTSLTATYDWPNGLQSTLAACLRRPVQMTVIARPGAGSDWAMETLDQAVATRADLVLLEFAINDADLTDGAAFARSRDNHLALLEALQPQGQVLLMTMNPVTGMKRLSRPALRRYYQMVRDLAASQGAGLVDLAPRWRVFLDAGGRLPDGLHPTAQHADQILIPALEESIAQALGQECGRP